MAAPYGDGQYAKEPPLGYGLNITDLFHIVEPKTGDPGINSAVDSKYPNVAIITFDRTNQFGGMWAKERLDLTMPFSTEIYLHLGHQYGKSGSVADGMTFTLHNDQAGINAIGGAGEGLGVCKGRKWTGAGQSTTPHGTYLRNSLVIEFDTYRNLISQSAFVDDPPGTAHCALLIPRADLIYSGDHKNVFTYTPIQDWVRFAADWIPDNNGGGTLNYSFSGTQKTYKVDNIISTFGATKVYWGFTGATGQVTSVQAAAITRLPKQGVTAEKTVKNTAGEDINHGHALPGDILGYTIRVTAQPLASAIGPIIIEDEISEHVEYVEGDVRVTTSAGSTIDVTPVYSGNVLNVNTTQYLTKEGDWIEITFSVKVKEDTAGKIVYNQAVTSASGLPEAEKTNITDVAVFAESEKKVSDNSEAGKNGGAVSVGDRITYDIVYANDEETAAEVVITDKLPDGVDFVSATGGGLYDDITHTVTWTLPDVPGGFLGTVSVTARVNDRAVVKVENSAAVRVGGNEPQTTNTVTNPVTPEEPVKKVSDDSEAGQGGGAVKAGDRIIYEISYLNYSEAAAAAVITDKLPAGVDFVSATDGGAYNAATHTVNWTLPDVPSGVGGTVSVVVRVNETAVVKIENYAAVQVSDGKPRVTNLVVNPIKGSGCMDVKQATKCRKIIKGRKIWVDDENAGDTRPPSVEIVLLRNGEVYKSISVSSAGDGAFTFGCLPIWKNSKHKYDYQVDEAMVPVNYTKTIDGYNIINTLN